MAAVGATTGARLKDALEQAPEEEAIHVTFSFDENRHLRVYNLLYIYLLNMIIGPLAMLGMYRTYRIGVKFKLTTKNIVMFLEIPANLVIVYNVCAGPIAYTAETSGQRFL
jgi:hypothetical protein